MEWYWITLIVFGCIFLVLLVFQLVCYIVYTILDVRLNYLKWKKKVNKAIDDYTVNNIHERLNDLEDSYRKLCKSIGKGVFKK